MVKNPKLDSAFNLIPKRLKPQNTDMYAWGLWGMSAFMGAIWLIQPFDWLSDQLFGEEKKKKWSFLSNL